MHTKEELDKLTHSIKEQTSELKEFREEVSDSAKDLKEIPKVLTKIDQRTTQFEEKYKKSLENIFFKTKTRRKETLQLARSRVNNMLYQWRAKLLKLKQEKMTRQGRKFLSCFHTLKPSKGNTNRN